MVLPSGVGYAMVWIVCWKGVSTLVVPDTLPSALTEKVPVNVIPKTSPPAENVATPLVFPNARPFVVPVGMKVIRPTPAKGTWPFTTGTWPGLVAGTQPFSVKE